jgi:hypothetical protein
MATDRTARLAVPAAAALLLWPAVWNGYPIVFADSGTYLSQAIQHYAGWDRPVFYSLFMLPLHATVTLWPVVAAQALLAAWVLWLVCRVLVPAISGIALAGLVFVLSAGTWLPWIVSELMPDLFTPLLVLVFCLLAWVPGRLSRLERVVLVGLATFMIASQQSSLPLACVIGGVLGFGRVLLHRRRHGLPSPKRSGFGFTQAGRAPGGHQHREGGEINLADRRTPTVMAGRVPAIFAPAAEAQMAGTPLTHVLARPAMTDEPRRLHRRWLLIVLPPALAVLGLCTVNLAAHGRFAVSPYGNVFLLARVIYDGPGMAVLRRDCPAAHWLLCPYLGRFPPTSDEFLWSTDSPLKPVGGPKAVSADADAIIRAALLADPLGEIRAALGNMGEQLMLFASGDGLNPWPDQVSPVIQRDFPAREQAAYASARQQMGLLVVPPLLVRIHRIVALGGVAACAVLLPLAFRRRAPCAGFLLAVLLVLPAGAAITGGLSAPHDRYQARIMWLPPFVAAVSFASLRRRRA